MDRMRWAERKTLLCSKWEASGVHIKGQSSEFEQKHPLLQQHPLGPPCSSPTFIFLLLPRKNHPDIHIIGIHMKNITSDVYFSRIHIKKKEEKSRILSQQHELGYTLYQGSGLPEHPVGNQTCRYGAKRQKVLQMKHNVNHLN